MQHADAPLWLKRLIWPLVRSEDRRVALLKLAKQWGVLSLTGRGADRPRLYPQLTPAIRDRLREYYRTDLEQLSKKLGADFTPWLEDRPVYLATPKAPSV